MNKYLFPAAIVIFLGIIPLVLGYSGAWPIAVGAAMALTVWLVAEDSTLENRKFALGAVWTIIACVVLLGLFWASAAAFAPVLPAATNVLSGAWLLVLFGIVGIVIGLLIRKENIDRRKIPEFAARMIAIVIAVFAMMWIIALS